MKLVSTLALAAVIALGGAASTAVAKEKPAAPAPAAYSYKLGKPFRAAVAPVQAALTANDTATATAKLAELEAIAVEPDEKFIAAQLRLNLAGKLSDKAMQSKAVDAMLASGSGAATPDLGKLNFYAGNFAYEGAKYQSAVQRLTEAERLGYKTDDVYLLLAESNFKLNQVPAGLGYVDKAVASAKAAGKTPPQTWYARAASVAYKAKNYAEAARWTRAQVMAYPTVENWRSALVVYRDSAQRDGNLNLDLFRLMRQTKSLAGERDYYEFASLATERGLPGEAKSIIDEGFATSAAPPGSRALSELRTMATAKIAGDRASLAASEKQAAASANGKTAAATADAYLGYGENAKAVTLYQMALTKGGVDADAVNTRLGIALARSGQKDAARQAFAAVKGPRAEIAAFWTLWLDQAPAA